MDLPLGDGTVAVDLPDCSVTVLTPPGGDPVDPDAAAAVAMADPHGPPLAERVGPDDDVAVVVTDGTRKTPTRTLLAHLLGALAVEGGGGDEDGDGDGEGDENEKQDGDSKRADARAEADVGAGSTDPSPAPPIDDLAGRVTVVVGLGLHRPMTDAELGAALGPFAPLAVNHDPDATVEAGTVEAPVDELDPCPVEVHPAVADADVVVSTGLVEPHQYAGFSGGAKTVVVGAGGEPLIRTTHGPAMLAQPGVRLGRVADNPFRETIDRAGDLAGPDFCLNVTRGPEGVYGAAAGNPRAVVAALARRARAALSVPVERRYDAVVAGVGAPKDATLYQASRALTYLVLGDHNPVRTGGRVVIPARLEEGAGQGTGERRFFERLRGASDPQSLYDEMRAGYEPGAQRAFVLARALREVDGYVTNAERPDVVESCLLTAAASVRAAIDPGSEVLVVPDALNTLVVADDDGV
jgi:nickel-dependent lactate racemase